MCTPADEPLGSLETSAELYVDVHRIIEREDEPMKEVQGQCIRGYPAEEVPTGLPKEAGVGTVREREPHAFSSLTDATSHL